MSHRTQSALGPREEAVSGGGPPGFEETDQDSLKAGSRGIDIDKLVSAEDMATLASKGVSIAALKTAFLRTTDPEVRFLVQGDYPSVLQVFENRLFSAKQRFVPKNGRGLLSL